MYPTLWNQLKCAKTSHHSRHVGYTTSRHVSYDCHPKQKTCNQREISSQDHVEGSFQTSHSRISSDHFNSLSMLPKIPPLLCNSMEINIKDFVTLSITNLKSMLHLMYVNLKGMTHKWHRYHSTKRDVHSCFTLRQHLVFFQDLSAIEFFLLHSLDYLIKGHGFNCLNCK